MIRLVLKRKILLSVGYCFFNLWTWVNVYLLIKTMPKSFIMENKRQKAGYNGKKTSFSDK
jgi:hypothetical protein